jgi:hypothetical protein
MSGCLESGKAIIRANSPPNAELFASWARFRLTRSNGKRADANLSNPEP